MGLARVVTRMQRAIRYPGVCQRLMQDPLGSEISSASRLSELRVVWFTTFARSCVGEIIRGRLSLLLIVTANLGIVPGFSGPLGDPDPISDHRLLWSV